jgi:exoribonuclease-2
VEKGTLIEFRDGGDRRLAIVDRPEGKKLWVVINEREQPRTLHPREFTYTVTGETFSPSKIVGFRQAVQPFLDPSSLEVAWEFYVEEGQSTTPSDLAELLFSEKSAVCCYAAHCLLSDDKLYFKQRKDSYEPRSVAQVTELKHQIEVEAQRQIQWESFLKRINETLVNHREGIPHPHSDGSKFQAWPETDRPWLESLDRYATFGEEAKHRQPALDLLSTLNRSNTPETAIDLLVELGLWSPHENLFLKRSQIPIPFSAQVLHVAQALLHSFPADPDSDRRDLTHLKVYTIDDESTQEIDDGLSVEREEGDRERLWIHIADPTRWLSPGDELDLEARRRSTTVYLPTGMIPMFPKDLATGPMSLVQGKSCCALSFGVVLAPSGEIEDYIVIPSRIQPTYRLTYEDVDEILELGVQAEAELLTLHQWAKRRQQWRQSQGSIVIRMPEASIKVSAEEEITIDVLEESASRQLVAEMMILAGEVAGHYGQTHELALPFRNQPQPELPPEEELQSLPPGPVRDSAIRRCMPRSEVSLTPARHASLGLATYTQVTSPIRRYGDLIAHFQIKAHLRGDPLPFAPEMLQNLLLSTASASYEATLVERQTNRYWGLEYLRRKGNQVWRALMLRWLREQDSLALVLLEDLGLELAARFDRALMPGEFLWLRVAHVDPRRDMIHFHEVPPEPGESRESESMSSLN